ncbi:metal-sensitive transcriptional regulator [Salipaludibacillus daqingensis]|uniref:metal-sensitive transcriptional regulator n=1 Tax=Salipaludibacillus daqingensis TaxID=3041001 RepID=UPI002474F7F9|nr:metal-sensitive transcriptional regulator [Salipaludibacillus daqingensis]
MEYSSDMKNRLKRVEGQVRGVLRMMDEEKDCKEIITQMTAIRSALDRATAYVVARNLETCLRKEAESDEEREEVIEEAIKMLVKSR